MNKGSLGREAKEVGISLYFANFVEKIGINYIRLHQLYKIL